MESDEQVTQQSQPLQNHFLISMPHLLEDSFHRSVVLICKHDESGSLGIVINRLSNHILDDIFNQLSLQPTSDRFRNTGVYEGGPVSPEVGLILHNDTETNWESSMAVSEQLILTNSIDILASMAQGTGPENMIMSLGYAGWGPGQLEHEISSNAWLTTPADHNILFSKNNETKWPSSAALLGIDIGLLSSQAGHA